MPEDAPNHKVLPNNLNNQTSGCGQRLVAARGLVGGRFDNKEAGAAWVFAA
jgi:hypothetical protein